jgi:hypothetical protein
LYYWDMMGNALKPSPEQEAALERYKSGQDMKLIAVAGAGKTTTLRLMAESNPRRRLLYLAFNRSIKEEAERKFPKNVDVKTLHGLAFGKVIKGKGPFEAKFCAGEGQVRPHHVIEALNLRNPILALVIRDTLGRFIRSGEERPKEEHIPIEYRAKREVLDPKQWAEEAKFILRATKRLWKKMKDPEDPFPISHDGYVRIWVEQGGNLKGWDGVLVDEAQDLDPLFLGLLEKHKGLLQRVYVGDPRQQIYGWRGAVNAMEHLDAPAAPLTWSFRFGDALGEAVRFLTAKSTGGPIPVVGKASWETRVDLSLPELPFTILTRSNVGAIRAVVLHNDLHGGRVHVVGGVEELCWLLEDVGALKDGGVRPKPHPELVGVRTWEELEELAGISPPIKVLLELVKKTDPYILADYLRRAQVPAHEARLLVSTAHKAKGREWDRVLLWDDFPTWWEEGWAPFGVEPDPEEENLFYVAMTRARRHLSLAKLPTALEAIADMEEEVYIEEEEEEEDGFLPSPSSTSSGGLLGWSGKVALFLAELQGRADLPEEVRKKAEALTLALHQALPLERILAAFSEEEERY